MSYYIKRNYESGSFSGCWAYAHGDEFPPDSECHEGALFKRLDLGKLYQYTGGAWVENATGGSGGLVISEADGVPSMSTPDTLIFDQADGFVLTDLGSGDARIDLVDATAAQHGLCPQLSGNAAQYLDGSGSWSAPAAAPAPDQDARIFALMGF